MKHIFVHISLTVALTFSMQAGTHWRKIAKPTTKDLKQVFFVDSLKGWVCGNRGVIFKTTNGGADWIEQVSNVEGDFVDLFMLNERIGWALSWDPFIDTLTYFGTRIHRTTNGGTLWNVEKYPIWGKYFHAITFFDSLEGWMVGETGDIERSVNAGLSWQQAQMETTQFSFMPILNVRFFSRDVGYGMGGALDYAGVLWKTKNGGETWKAFTVSPEPVYELHFIDSSNCVGIAGDYDVGTSMVRSSDSGDTWEYTFLDVFGQPRGMSFRTPREAWVPAGNLLMATYDTARHWTVTDTLGWRIPYDLCFTDSLTGYIALDSGYIYKYSKNLVTVTESYESKPAGVKLFQNYPNPFNPSTVIRFQIPRENHVTLKVFDVLGREIRTLVDDMRVAGEHSVEWDTRGISSGVYLCALSSGGFTDTKKMLLLR